MDLTLLKPLNLWAQRWHRLTGYALLEKRVAESIRDSTVGNSFDLVWVDSGYLVGPAALPVLRSRAPKLVSYNNDDPTGTRDGNSWFIYRKTIPEYDLVVAVRDVTAAELLDFGARRVSRVFMSYDEVEHAPLVLSQEDQDKWAQQVVFVGTWMPERGPFMEKLVRAGVPLSIYGDRWTKAKEWASIRSAWKGPALYGADYVKALQAAKVSLGLLSKGNRDQHTTRSVEIPALGGLLCAERTPEHLSMFKEDSEAVFWENAEECITRCRDLLNDEPRRQMIAAAGQRRVRELGVGNEKVVTSILETLLSKE